MPIYGVNGQRVEAASPQNALNKAGAGRPTAMIPSPLTTSMGAYPNRTVSGTGRPAAMIPSPLITSAGAYPTRTVPRPSTVAMETNAEELPSQHEQFATTFNFRGDPVPVSCEPGLEENVPKALSSAKFETWWARVEKDANFVIEGIRFQSIDMFGPTNPGFIKFKLEAKAGGKTCPGIIFMRGGAPAILVVLKKSDDGELFTVTVNQPRIGAGSSSFCEIPAGMLDGAGNLAGVAAKEMKEETGLVINEKDLINLTEMAHGPDSRHQGIYSTCGGSDEYNPIFLYRKVVEPKFINDLQGKATGNADEFEQITVRVIPFEQLWQVSADSKALSALCLHEFLLKNGKLAKF